MTRGVSRPPPLTPPAAPAPNKASTTRRGIRRDKKKSAKAAGRAAAATASAPPPPNPGKKGGATDAAARQPSHPTPDVGPYIHVAGARVQKVGLQSRRPGDVGASPPNGGGWSDGSDDGLPTFLQAPSPAEWKAKLSRKERRKLAQAKSAGRGAGSEVISARLADAARQLAGGRADSGSPKNSPLHRPADLSPRNGANRGASASTARNQSNGRAGGGGGGGGRAKGGAGFGMTADWSTVLDAILRQLLVQLTPLESERNSRRSILDRADRILKRSGLQVGVYGSARTGVILPDSDLDLCATKPAPKTPGGFTVNRPPQPRKSGYSNPDFVNVLRELRRGHGGFCNIIPVAHARVPILKFQDRATGIDVDISFTRDGVTTSDYLANEFSRPRFELARPLVVLVKLLLRKWNLHDPKEGGVGSFVVSLMVLWYLTVINEGHWTLPDDHPQSPKTAGRLVTPPQPVPSASQPVEGGEFDEVNEHMTNAPGRLAPLLVGFLQYYGELFPFKTTGVDLARGATFEKPPSSDLHFTNPTLPGHNVSAAASSFGVNVRPRFAAAARTLAGLAPKTKINKGPSAPNDPETAAHSLFGDLSKRRWSEEGYRQFKLQRRQEDEARRQSRAAARAAAQGPSDESRSDEDDSGSDGRDDEEEGGDSDDTAPQRPPLAAAAGDGDASDSDSSDIFFRNVIVRSPHMGPTVPHTNATAAGKKGTRHVRIRRRRPRGDTAGRVHDN